MTSPAATQATFRTGLRLPPFIFPAVVGARDQIALGAILAAVYIAALGAQQDRLVIPIVLVGAVVAVVSPAAGLAMFVVMMPMREPEILVPLRFNAIMAGALALGCLIRLPMDQVRLRLHPGVLLLIGYLLISALSLVPAVSGNPTDWLPSALNTFLRLSTGVALFLSAGYLFHVMPVRSILLLALAGTTMAALLAFGDIAGFLPFESLTQGLVENTGSARASGAFADPNFLGLYMATAAVFWLGVLFTLRRPMQLALLPVVILLLLCVVLTYSRGAFAGLAAGLAVLAALRSRVASVAFLILAGVIAFTLYPTFLEARQGGELSPVDSYDLLLSQASRATIAGAGVAMFMAFPIFGVGYGVFQFVSPEYFRGGSPDSTFSHNQYLNILAEQGLVGAAIVGTLIVLVALLIRRSRSSVKGPALAMGATFLVTSIFLHSATVFQSSSLIWLVMAAVLVTRDDPAADADGTERTEPIEET